MKRATRGVGPGRDGILGTCPRHGRQSLLKALLFHLTNPPLQKFVQQHSEEFGDGFSIEIYGTLDAETKE